MFGMSPGLTFIFLVILAFLTMLTISSVVGDWRRVQVAKHTGKSEPKHSDK